MKNGDHYARKFKLHHCIGNRKFAKQVETIQAEARKELEKENWALKLRIEDLENQLASAGWEADALRDQISVNHEMGQ